MKHHHRIAATCIVAAIVAPIALLRAGEYAPPSAPAANLASLHDFDFLVGDWNIHHLRLKERLAGSTEWDEFEGTCSMRTTMGGYGNVDDNVIKLPGGAYRAMGFRAYDSKTGLWAIWWLDGRTPAAALEPPVRGRFLNGIGLFYADDTLRGKPIRVRYTWSQITPTSAHWEQAFSPDGGKTWETNWKMDLTRAR